MTIEELKKFPIGTLFISTQYPANAWIKNTESKYACFRLAQPLSHKQNYNDVEANQYIIKQADSGQISHILTWLVKYSMLRQSVIKPCGVCGDT